MVRPPILRGESSPYSLLPHEITSFADFKRQSPIALLGYRMEIWPKYPRVASVSTNFQPACTDYNNEIKSKYLLLSTNNLCIYPLDDILEPSYTKRSFLVANSTTFYRDITYRVILRPGIPEVRIASVINLLLSTCWRNQIKLSMLLFVSYLRMQSLLEFNAVTVYFTDCSKQRSTAHVFHTLTYLNNTASIHWG